MKAKTLLIAGLMAVLFAFGLAALGCAPRSHVDTAAISAGTHVTAVSPVNAEPMILDAMYVAPEVVDIGNTIAAATPVARIENAKNMTRITPVPIDSYLEVQYAYIGPPSLKPKAGNDHQRNANGFTGLSADHFARADV